MVTAPAHVVKAAAGLGRVVRRCWPMLNIHLIRPTAWLPVFLSQGMMSAGACVSTFYFRWRRPEPTGTPRLDLQEPCMFSRRLSVLQLVLVLTASLAITLAPTSRWAAAQDPAVKQPSPKEGPTDAPAAKVGERWRQRVQEITAGDGSAGRGAVVTAQLDEAKFKHAVVDFELREMKGKNIVVDYFGPGEKKLLLGAHYDRVSSGVGAVDNASSCAAVLQLLERLREKPLANYQVGAVFFDLEERGLIGSEAFAANKQQHPDIFVNLDIFAYGDTLWVMSPAPQGKLPQAFQSGAGDYPLSLGDKYPPSDHRSFISQGVPTLGVSLIDGEEIQPTIDMLFNGRRGREAPRIFSIIHTPGDALDKLEPDDVAAGLPVLESCLRSLDAEQPSE